MNGYVGSSSYTEEQLNELRRDAAEKTRAALRAGDAGEAAGQAARISAIDAELRAKKGGG